MEGKIECASIKVCFFFVPREVIRERIIVLLVMRECGHFVCLVCGCMQAMKRQNLEQSLLDFIIFRELCSIQVLCSVWLNSKIISA